MEAIVQFATEDETKRSRAEARKTQSAIDKLKDATKASVGWAILANQKKHELAEEMARAEHVRYLISVHMISITKAETSFSSIK